MRSLKPLSQILLLCFFIQPIHQSFAQYNAKITKRLEAILTTESNWEKGVFVSKDEAIDIMDKIAEVKIIAERSGVPEFKENLREVNYLLMESMPNRNNLKSLLEQLIDQSYTLGNSSQNNVASVLEKILKEYPSDWKLGIFLSEQEAKKVKRELLVLNEKLLKLNENILVDKVKVLISKLEMSMPNRSGIFDEIKVLAEEIKDSNI